MTMVQPMALRVTDHRAFASRARLTIIVFGAWLAFSALQIIVSAALAKPGDIKWGRELLVDLTMVLYWTVVTFPLATWHRYLRSTGRGLATIVLLHIPLLLLVILGDTYSTRATMQLFTGVAPAAPAIFTITYFADFDTLSYLAVVILTDAWIARQAAGAEELRASRLESLLARARLEYLEAQLQ